MNTRKFQAAFLTVAALVAVPAAAAQTAPEERSETPATVSQRTTVHVINNNWHDITVYAFMDGHRLLLGKVTSFTSRVLTLPPRFLKWSGEVRLIAEPFAPVGFSSGRNLPAQQLAELGTTTSFPQSVAKSRNLRLRRRDTTANAIRGRRVAYVSEPLVVNAGDVVEWRLLSNIRQSTIFIYRRF